MASRYFGISLGKNAHEVSEDSRTTSKAIELVVDLTAGASRLDVIVALEKIKDHMLRGVWPPA